jgi:hypothetical protein
VTFLLFDELWVECDPGDALAVASIVQTTMMTAAMALGVGVPVTVQPAPEGPPQFTPDQLSRWRWGPAVDDLAGSASEAMDIVEEPVNCWKGI